MPRVVGLAILTFTAYPALISPSHAEETTRNTLRLREISNSTTQQNATTQHGVTIAAPISRTAARIDHDTKSGITVLRWRNPRLAKANYLPVPEPTAQPLVPVAQETDLGVKRDFAVMPAAHELPIPQDIPEVPAVTASDPFNDPFGDQSTNSGSAPEQELSAPKFTAAQEPAELPPATEAPATEAPATEAPATGSNSDTWQDDPPPSLSLSEPEEDNSEACTRTYNQRDCCAEGDLCNSATNRWHRDVISKISLDITPNYRPDETDPFVEESERDREMSKSPVREWRDRKGNVLATGRLTNIKRGKLLVLDENTQVVKLKYGDLSDDDLCFLTAWWGVPTECTLSDAEHLGRDWNPMTLTWKASGLCHKPLYFEQVQLERYGHTAGPLRQPVLSGAHFFLNLVTLPYQAGINPPWECRYALGYYRPGNCAPWLVPPVPLSVRGGLWQAGAMVGGVALIP